jgi:hypothetical protein
MLQQVNTRVTIGKYRHLTANDWNTITAQIAGNRTASITTSSGRAVQFSRAEVDFISAKYPTRGQA